MRRIALVIGLAILTSTSAQAQNQAARSAVCTSDNSEAVTVAKVASDPAAWMGRCVQMEGLYSNERVYQDADAIYGLNDHSVGGFVDGLGAKRGAWRGTFVGRVASCATAEQTLLTAQLRSPGISLHERVLGCTTQAGPFLMFMSHGEIKPSGLKRRLPGAKGGNLVAVPDGWQHRGAVVERAEAFQAALSERDVDALEAILGDRYRAERLLADTDNALSRIKSRESRPALFMQRNAGADAMAAEACWSLMGAARVNWPIDSRDADNQPSRPYACLRVEGVMRDGSWRYRVDPSSDVSGLDEP